jgi:hypothetical protein
MELISQRDKIMKRKDNFRVNLPEERFVSELEFVDLARSYLNHFDVECHQIEVVLFDRIVYVAKAVLEEEGEFGWVVGGDCPFLDLNSDEISNAAEALAIYAWCMRDWELFTGAGRFDADIADPRLAPDWRKCEVNHPFQLWHSPRAAHIKYHVVAYLGEEIRHPDIRDRCRRMGIEWQQRA